MANLFEFVCALIPILEDNYILFMKLYSNEVEDRLKITDTPEIISKYQSINVYDIYNKYSKEIDIFISQMINQFTDKQLINMYNNFNTLNIDLKKKQVTKKVLISSYNVFDNSIHLERKKSKVALFHELLHASSTIVSWEEKKAYSGFMQLKLLSGQYIGIGINEGYTQVLNKRYFCDEKNISLAYKYTTIIADLIEKIIGKNRMENLYLTSNLQSLIQELSDNYNKNIAIELILLLDYAYDILMLERKSKKDKNTLSIVLKRVTTNLLIIYFNKQLNQYHNKQIDQEQIISKSIDFICKSFFNIQLGSDHYTTSLTKEEINSVMDKVIKEKTYQKTI